MVCSTVYQSALQWPVEWTVIYLQVIRLERRARSQEWSVHAASSESIIVLGLKLTRQTLWNQLLSTSQWSCWMSRPVTQADRTQTRQAAPWCYTQQSYRNNALFCTAAPSVCNDCTPKGAEVRMRQSTREFPSELSFHRYTKTDLLTPEQQHAAEKTRFSTAMQGVCFYLTFNCSGLWRSKPSWRIFRCFFLLYKSLELHRILWSSVLFPPDHLPDSSQKQTTVDLR